MSYTFDDVIKRNKEVKESKYYCISCNNEVSYEEINDYYLDTNKGHCKKCVNTNNFPIEPTEKPISKLNNSKIENKNKESLIQKKIF